MATYTYTWKGESKNAIIPLLSKPPSQSDEQSLGPNFKARPIRHYRKQLIPNERTSGIRGSSINIDQPGSSVYLGNDNTCFNCVDNVSSNGIKIYIENNNENCRCDKENNRIKSGLTENKNINNDPNFKPYSFSTKQYLQRKCFTYKQRLAGTKDPNIEYLIPGTNIAKQPTDDDNGPQNLLSLTCCEPNNCRKIIYKPNNSQYATQGAVSSSSRIQRLKYNTITKNGNSFTNAYGAAAANAGRYNTTGNAPYFIKSKVNICNKSLYNIYGKNTCV